MGTSQAKEFKEYFKEKRFITFTHEGKECDDSLDKAFNKKLADSRKTWLENYNRDDVLDTNQQEISYSDFVTVNLFIFRIMIVKEVFLLLSMGLKRVLEKFYLLPSRKS